jgi:predicted Zn finger-like uncharacterized protein
MRLVCPNCAAQYEVDDSAIPDNGRDVQCANCGNTWFQGPAAGADNIGAEHEAEPIAAPTPRATDPAVFDILREEVAHETTVRNSEIAAAERDAAEAMPHAQQDIEIHEDAADRPAPESDGDTPMGAYNAESYPLEDTTNDDGEVNIAHDATGDATERSDESDASEPGDQSGDAQDSGQNDNDSLPAETFAVRARAGRAKLRANRADIERAHRQRQQISTEDADAPTQFEEIAPTAQPTEGEVENGAETEARNHASLPEIKELQESLRIARDKANRAGPAELEVTNPKRRGGRTGFFAAVLLALILVAAYALKAQIIAAAPQTQPYLNQYTALVDVGRRELAVAVDAIAGLVRDLVAKYR